MSFKKDFNEYIPKGAIFSLLSDSVKQKFKNMHGVSGSNTSISNLQ